MVITVEQDSIGPPSNTFYWEPTPEQLAYFDDVWSGKIAVVVPTYHDGYDHFI